MCLLNYLWYELEDKVNIERWWHKEAFHITHGMNVTAGPQPWKNFIQKNVHNEKIQTDTYYQRREKIWRNVDYNSKISIQSSFENPCFWFVGPWTVCHVFKNINENLKQGGTVEKSFMKIFWLLFFSLMSFSHVLFGF